MKTLVLLTMLCCITIVSKAQFIRNQTHCSLTVSQVCYNPPTCMKTLTATIAVPAGAVVPMPAACPAPQETAYMVCWAACPGTCTVVAATLPPVVCIAGMPMSAPLGPCAPCPPVTVSYDPATGDLIIQ